MPSLADALDEARIGMQEPTLHGQIVESRIPVPVTYCPWCKAAIYKHNRIYCSDKHQRKAEEKRKVSFTTDQPFIPSNVPKSTTKLSIEGLSILAYPSMRLVKKCRNQKELENEYKALSRLLQTYRDDLLRPMGTCHKCALPLSENHDCP